MALSQEIAQALISIGAVKFNLEDPVTLHSGLKAPIYVNNREIPSHPNEWKKVIEGFIELIQQNNIKFDVIVGVETGGIPHSAVLGYKLEKPSTFVRKKVKDHGIRSRIEGDEVYGKKALFIEDHISTGGSSLEAIQTLREAGAIVLFCLSITSHELAEAGRAFEKAGIVLLTLTSLREIVNKATDDKIISTENKQDIEQWFSDPWAWTREHQ